MKTYRRYNYKKLINNLPKIRYVYLKAVLKTRWITLILDFLIPLFLFLFCVGSGENDNESNLATTARIAVTLYLIIGSFSLFVTFIDTLACLIAWKRKFERVLLPLAKLASAFSLAAKFEAAML